MARTIALVHRFLGERPYLRILRTKVGNLIHRFTLKPFVYQSEIVNADMPWQPGELSFVYEAKNLHVARIGRRRSDYRSAYRILGGDRSSTPVIVCWQPKGVSRFEVHGQSVAAFGPGNVKVAELLVESNVSTRVRMEEKQHGSKFPVVVMSGRSIDSRLSVRKSDFLIVERNVGHESGWRSWQNVLHFNYWLDVPRTPNGKQSLTVIFSALGGKYDFTYNYKSALDGCDSYRLYLIDDFGVRGSYYFADHRDTTIFDEVQVFLAEIIDVLGVSLENVTFAGSSKGGTGALLHGLAIGTGKVVIGAPQVYPGTYLQKVAPDILRFIAGGSGDEARKWLDRTIVERITTSNSRTQVRIIVGTKDHHLVHHVKPLLAMTDTPQHDIKALVIPELSHDNIGLIYRHYLKSVIDKGVYEDIDAMLPYNIQVTRGQSTDLEVQVWHPADEEVAIDLYDDTELIRRVGYVTEDFIRIVDVPDSAIRLRFSRAQLGKNEPFAFFDSSPIRAYESSS